MIAKQATPSWHLAVLTSAKAVRPETWGENGAAVPEAFLEFSGHDELGWGREGVSGQGVKPGERELRA